MKKAAVKTIKKAQSTDKAIDAKVVKTKINS
jgi:hypothetical protein